MEKLYSVRIIRKENQVVQGVYIKEFWMLCGVYVNEFIIEYDNTSIDNDMVDCNIFLDEDIMDLVELESKYKINIVKGQIKEDLSSKDKRRKFGRRIEKDLLKIPLLLEWNNEWKEDFKQLYNAFVDSDFAYNNYLTHLFLNQFSEEMKLTQLEVLKDCLNKIYASNQAIEGLVQRRFAYFNCARKINRVNMSFEGRRVFDDEKVMKVTHQMSIEDIRFTMGDVLAGLIGVNRKDLWEIGEMHLQMALAKELDNKYSAFIYYALAHYYEINQQNEKQAWELYKEMKEIAPENYRMLFKHAAQEFREKKQLQSWQSFLHLYNNIGNRICKKWFQPLELEYYYKCARILSKIPEEIAIRMGIPHINEREIERIERNYFLQSNFMKKFLFNDNLKEIYIWYFMKKMKSHKISDIIK